MFLIAAIRSANNGIYLVNGNNKVNPCKVIIDQPGIKMEYSGYMSTVERLNSSRSIGVDLIVEVIII